MDTSERGEAIASRAARMGISNRDLAEQAGVSRGALQRALAGEPVRDSTLGMIEATLDRIEEGIGRDAPPAATVSTVTLSDGSVVTFTGSPAGVAEAAQAFLARRKTGRTD